MKNNKILTIILIVLVVLLSGFISYDKFIGNIGENKEQNDNDEVVVENNLKDDQKIEYTYSNMEGVYSFDQQNGDEEYHFNLVLKKDGTYKYSECLDVEKGYYGNYIIEDNKILLNGIFTFGTSPSLEVDLSKKTLMINSFNEITDNNPSYEEFIKDKKTTVIIKKNEKKNVSDYDFNKVIKTYKVFNDAE